MDPGVTSGLLAATFTASFVEFVEALTIVLAMGMTRSWRSTMVGVAAAVVALVAFTAGVGYALTAWLPKALLRSSGLKALHDEDEAFASQAAAARAVARSPTARWHASPKTT